MDKFTVDTIVTVIGLLVYVLGIPGNILSAIVWLRRRKNSSAIYLAALAINDLVIVLIRFGYSVIPHNSNDELYWFLLPAWYLLKSARILEPLLIVGFSVLRLFAILRPFQVSFYVRQLC